MFTHACDMYRHHAIRVQQYKSANDHRSITPKNTRILASERQFAQRLLIAQIPDQAWDRGKNQNSNMLHVTHFHAAYSNKYDVSLANLSGSRTGKTHV